mmetsp:Transcript_20564/g.51144  ORF Transcript_20564/g.51144 Transcript_20564/m.51144 type:complete len:95 (+) Transcript_20564:1328-1612(+)
MVATKVVADHFVANRINIESDDICYRWTDDISYIDIVKRHSQRFPGKTWRITGIDDEGGGGGRRRRRALPPPPRQFRLILTLRVKQLYLSHLLQ